MSILMAVLVLPTPDGPMKAPERCEGGYGEGGCGNSNVTSFGRLSIRFIYSLYLALHLCPSLFKERPIALRVHVCVDNLTICVDLLLLNCWRLACIEQFLPFQVGQAPAKNSFHKTRIIGVLHKKGSNA